MSDAAWLLSAGLPRSVASTAAAPPASAEVPRSALSRAAIPTTGVDLPRGALQGSAAAFVAALAGAAAVGSRRRRTLRAGRGADRRVVACSAAADAAGAATSRGPSRIGVLLLNIGTPASTSVQDVREYLGRFLADDRVIEIKPALLKQVLLQVLLATRPQNSAKAYSKIWDDERGSPLLYHSQDLAKGLQEELGDRFLVRIAMAYSEPFVKDSLQELASAGIDEVLLVPMFPQYASSTTGSLLENAYKAAAEVYCTPYLRVVPPFYDSQLYLQAMRKEISERIGPSGADVDHVLFSFHGLPEAQCRQTDPTSEYCLKQPDCCGRIFETNRNCYRAQCFETARLLAGELGLEENKWSIGFQSRLTLRNTVQWIRPYTDELLEELAQNGVRRLAVVAPSFTADCVETLEELGLEGREQFEEAGGEELVLIPCLNSSDVWVQSLAEILRKQVPHAVSSEADVGLEEELVMEPV